MRSTHIKTTSIYSSYNLLTPPLSHTPHYVHRDDNFTFTNNNNMKLHKVELLILFVQVGVSFPVATIKSGYYTFYKKSVFPVSFCVSIYAFNTVCNNRYIIKAIINICSQINMTIITIM